MTQEEVLHSAFDIETHKKTFVNYLEVVITPDGTIEYAVPSHQEKLIRIATEKLSVSRRELYDMCPIEYMFDVTKWLCKITGYVSVWDNFFCGYPNKDQIAALRMLRDEGVFRGEL